MKASAKSPKIPVIEIALALVAIGLVGFTAWYVWDSKHKTDEVLDAANKTSSTAVAKADQKDISVVTAKLPDGWSVSSATSENVVIKSGADACYTSVSYNPEGGKAGDEEVANPNFTNNGDPVRKLSTGQQVLQTSGGSQPVDVTVSRIGSGDAVRYQSFGSVTSGLQTAIVSASCPTQNGLTGAADVLQAITVNHKL